ncbi:aldose 1-epimerase [Cohnella suwonensis]|uniref:Aldose 1-epimerase n=1 Tax=Cohnella suwonensis TaxID=696072 RepID=A0ABW0M0U3_9BACL
MTERYAKQGVYENVPAIYLKHGKYSAILLPTLGGNLVSFRDDENGYRFLREPEGAEWGDFVAKPILHGIPVLFPPNRYDAGSFDFDGRSYRLPVNEAHTNNHIHGFVYDSEWEVEALSEDENECRVMVSFVFDEKHPDFAAFPHRVVLRQSFALSEQGLEQRFDAINESEQALPFMLGFHTTLNAPFAPGSDAGDIRCGIPIGDRWELNARQLPTERSLPLNGGEQALAAGQGDPYFEELDNHYAASGADGGRNAVTVEDAKAGVRFVYEAGGAYKHWMVYNAKANGKFFCPEPQTGMVNAPNVGLPEGVTGLIRLEPGAKWTETSRMYSE